MAVTAMPRLGLPLVRVMFVMSFLNGRAMVAGQKTAANEIIKMAGGVNAVDSQAEGGAPRGTGFSINGMRTASTNILLDGAANNDEFTATVGQ